MIFIKTLLTGLSGVSLCIANISGIVTDTGTTPIAGAVVQLEEGGQTATTGADGSFTLVAGSTGILSSNGNLPQNGLSGFITGNLINLYIAERAVVEVATFDLRGKMLSTVRKSMDEGSHSISLPYQGTGIYLYKVKSGNSELVLKSNSIAGTPSGRVLSTQGLSPKSFPKQAKFMATTSDVITSTKEGYLNYHCVIRNSDTSGIVIKMIENAGDITDADGNVYQSVRIGNQVWTVENLRVTKYNDSTPILNVTDSAAWNTISVNQLETPAYAYYDYNTNADSIKKFGALYNWYVVSPTNPRKIAPAGWHVPTNAEWDALQNYLIAKGYNWDGTTTGNKIGKSLAARTGWEPGGRGAIGSDLTKNNRSGFAALPGGVLRFDGIFVNKGTHGFWWSATNDAASNAWFRILECRGGNLVDKMSCPKSYGFSVRLVRD